MNAWQVLYRPRQFWAALFSAPVEAELAQVADWLDPAQMALFRRMHPGEQVHSIRVMQAVMAKSQGVGEANQRDLLVAALLHDVGKSRYPLRIWERVLIVLGKRIAPQAARRWGCGAPAGWRRAFAVAVQHADWGAQMAEAAGASSLAAGLIRRHQEEPSAGDGGIEDQLLSILQTVDQEL